MIAQALEPQIPAGSAVAGYLPMRGEPDVLRFLKLHTGRRGGTAFLPVTPTDGSRELLWVRWSPESGLRKHPVLPLQEPDAEPGAELSLAQVLEASGEHLSLLVPALALDEAGARMGQGGGFYDTSLSALPALRRHGTGLNCRIIGVAHSAELLPAGAFPVEAHDLRVDAAVTENGFVQLRRAYN